eukprot:6466955-Amphidinium_carterae.3
MARCHMSPTSSARLHGTVVAALTSARAYRRDTGTCTLRLLEALEEILSHWFVLGTLLEHKMPFQGLDSRTAR